jgi:anti-anti-sigma factor
VALRIQGDIEGDHVEGTLASLLRQLDDEALDDFEAVRIDCSQVTYLSSAGLAMLVHFRALAGRDVVLTEAPPAILRTLETGGLDVMFLDPT